MTDTAWDRLVAENEIKRVHLRYCRGIDRMDWDIVRSCYHPDATDHHGDYVGGVEGFIEYGKANLPKFVSTSHFVCNQLVEIAGDVAFAEHYVIASHRMAGQEGAPATDWVANVRYIDRLERRSGEWRIARRRVLVDSDRMEAVASDTPMPDAQLRGYRSRDDPSYQR